MHDMTLPDTASPLASDRSADDADELRWLAVCNRDRSSDGQFFYAVKTTAVYCRPSCASRQPLRGNVSFYEKAEDAAKAGYRPCKRCRPDTTSPVDAQARAVARACRFIESAADTPTLSELAAQAGMSPHHFHRVFKAATGVTPRAYAQQHRVNRLSAGLSAPVPARPDITSAYLEAGYGSSAAFYGQAREVLGMTPTRYRQGGHHETLRFAVGRCSLGEILVAATDAGICAILLGDDAQALVRDLQDRFPKAEIIGGDADFERLVAEVVGFVDAPAQGLGLPLDVRGTAFQQRVWQALREIPAGSTATYAEIARRIGAPSAVRAVAGACAANAIAVAIPCHRVVRTDQSLSGYRWGVDRKSALLALERGSAKDTA